MVDFVKNLKFNFIKNRNLSIKLLIFYFVSRPLLYNSRQHSSWKQFGNASIYEKHLISSKEFQNNYSC
jgi:hypothetical protein